jgi:hypothetical protein
MCLDTHECRQWCDLGGHRAVTSCWSKDPMPGSVRRYLTRSNATSFERKERFHSIIPYSFPPSHPHDFLMVQANQSCQKHDSASCKVKLWIFSLSSLCRRVNPQKSSRRETRRQREKRYAICRKIREPLFNQSQTKTFELSSFKLSRARGSFSSPLHLHSNTL